MILFWVRASEQIGLGPLIRSSYLATLVRKKHSVQLALNEDRIALRFLRERNIKHCLHSDVKDILKEKPTALIFDLRRIDPLDRELRQLAREQGIPTIELLEPGVESLPADWGIDFSLETDQSSLDSEPAAARENIISQNMVLHHRFRHFFLVERKHRPRLRKIFVCLGAAPDYRQLRLVIDALSRRQVLVKVAAGFYLKNSNRKVLRRLYPGLRFVGKTESLARSFFEADAAVVASGVAAYEAAACGTPTLYLTRHPIQEKIANQFAQAGAGIKLGSVDTLDSIQWPDILIGLNLEKRRAMAAAGKKMVDGLGAVRLIDFLTAKGMVQLKI